jgi:putative FmdB family regulatory protein
MPTYEYLCHSCHEEFEFQQRMSDPPRAGCPYCGSQDTHRLISHSSFVLKGSGWYVTDYGRKGGGGSGEGGRKKPAPSNATDETPASSKTPATPGTGS